jgi:hypothetical protein
MKVAGYCKSEKEGLLGCYKVSSCAGCLRSVLELSCEGRLHEAIRVRLPALQPQPWLGAGISWRRGHHVILKCTLFNIITFITTTKT